MSAARVSPGNILEMQTPVPTRCNNKREGKRRLLEVMKRFMAQSVVI